MPCMRSHSATLCLVDDELEPVIDQEAAKFRSLELVDDAEEWLAIVADGEGL